MGWAQRDWDLTCHRSGYWTPPSGRLWAVMLTPQTALHASFAKLLRQDCGRPGSTRRPVARARLRAVSPPRRPTGRASGRPLCTSLDIAAKRGDVDPLQPLLSHAPHSHTSFLRAACFAAREGRKRSSERSECEGPCTLEAWDTSKAWLIIAQV